MNGRNLAALACAAAALGIAAYFVDGSSRPSAPKLNGRAILPGLDVQSVAKIEIGESLALSAGDAGWTVDTLGGYPADRAKIADNLLKLAELKVGQVARGRALGTAMKVVLKDSAGKELANLSLGDRHMAKPSGQAAMYGGGGYPDGRYVAFGGETVLVKDALDAFDGDAKKWCNTRIIDLKPDSVTAVAFEGAGEKVELEKGTNGVWTVKGIGENEEFDSSKSYALESGLSYLDFDSIADASLTDEALGFATGFVYTVTAKDGTNSVVHTAKLGNRTPSGGRYLNLDGGKWNFTISSYAADKMTKTRADLVKEKEKPKAEEPPEAKTGDAPAPQPEAEKSAAAAAPQEAPPPAAEKVETTTATEADGLSAEAEARMGGHDVE